MFGFRAKGLALAFVTLSLLYSQEILSTYNQHKQLVDGQATRIKNMGMEITAALRTEGKKFVEKNGKPVLRVRLEWQKPGTPAAAPTPKSKPALELVK